MTNEKQDPEVLDNPEEGVGDESGYEEAFAYDPEQFELPDDFEYEEVEEDGSSK